MPWIKTISENEAEGTLREVYDRIAGARGQASNIMRVQSLHPEAMAAHLDLYMAVMFGRSGLRRGESIVLPALAASVFLVSAYLYLLSSATPAAALVPDAPIP